ncbi:hypothetical protein IFM89_004968 [Coptis chinensis]|uniref:Uncharacterized protein n=1 Tax=Coptis chinensis TaxID=261450 RepID=A0A835HTR2_9MAGN|nr:hypothetical protein IFM89_004968 [Coptis chinensis]
MMNIACFSLQLLLDTHWEDDTIHSSSQGSPNRPHLPSPRRRLVTPLKRKPNRILTGRRKPKKWSSFEEQALIDAAKE